MFPKLEPALILILDAIERINAYTKGLSSPDKYLASHREFVASVMGFISLSVEQLPGELKDQHPEIDWNAIAGFRNAGKPERTELSADNLVQFLRQDLPILQEGLREILAKLKKK